MEKWGVVPCFSIFFTLWNLEALLLLHFRNHKNIACVGGKWGN